MLRAFRILVLFGLPCTLFSFSSVTSPAITRTPAVPRSGRLCSMWDGANYGEDEADGSLPLEPISLELTNDFRTFLNQLAIQSLLFFMNSLKDRHTALWLEDFTQPVIRSRTKDQESDQVLSNMAKALNDAMHETQMERPIRLLTYHGLGAMDMARFPTWEAYFQTLLEEPSVIYMVESTRPHVPTYEMEINPASLCSRLISVREQIALEFVNDLDVVAEMSYAQRQPDRGSEEEAADEDRLFLEISVHEDYKPSPLRKGNFDLLLTLTTQESILRLIRDTESMPLAWRILLQSVYVERVRTHFTGSNWYGRAEDFLRHLQELPPTTVQLPADPTSTSPDTVAGSSSLVDPQQILHRVLEERERVADEWLEVAKSVPLEHTAIKRMQLNRLMGIEDAPVDQGFE